MIGFREMGDDELPRKAKAKGAPVKTSVIVRASDITMRAKVWRWQDHLLVGALELTAGPGLGKSLVHCCYHACVTAGLKWPDGAPGIEPMNTIMLTAEDKLDDEVVPRLIAAGADLSRVHIVKAIKMDDKARQFLLADDLDHIEKDIAEIGNVGLVTIDPITAYMGGKMDSHKTTEVRAQLGPLKDLAERCEVAISAITHPSKNASQKAIDHFIGSQGFIAAARLAHITVNELDEESNETGRVLYAHAKWNPTVRQPTLAYRIASGDIGQDEQTGEVIAAPRVVWDGTVDISADAALAAMRKGDGRSSDDLETAKAILAEMLRNGPRPKIEIDERMASLGIGNKTLRNAKERLGISTKQKSRTWWWALPQDEEKELPLDGAALMAKELLLPSKGATGRSDAPSS
jgi:putative DNA primase/helicase